MTLEELRAKWPRYNMLDSGRVLTVIRGSLRDAMWNGRADFYHPSHETRYRMADAAIAALEGK